MAASCKNFVNEENAIGETLLHHACFYGMIEKCYVLLDMGAEFKKTKNGDEPLHYSAFSGADPFLTIELVKIGQKPDSRNSKGLSPIHLSADVKIAGYFARWGERNGIEARSLLDCEGRTPEKAAFDFGRKAVGDFWRSRFFMLEERH